MTLNTVRAALAKRAAIARAAGSAAVPVVALVMALVMAPLITPSSTAHAQGPAPNAAVAARAAPAGNAERGKQLYYDHGCYSCHGFNGETGARDLVGTGSPLVTDEATFILFLRMRADQAPVFPATRMPNYPVESLSDADARAIFAFVRTFELDAPPVADEPTLQAIVESVERSAGP